MNLQQTKLVIFIRIRVISLFTCNKCPLLSEVVIKCNINSSNQLPKPELTLDINIPQELLVVLFFSLCTSNLYLSFTLTNQSHYSILLILCKNDSRLVPWVIFTSKDNSNISLSPHAQYSSQSIGLPEVPLHQLEIRAGKVLCTSRAE